MERERGQTHYLECWRVHHSCAVAVVLLLREKLEQTKPFVELSYDENTGEEASEAKHVLDGINAALAQ